MGRYRPGWFALLVCLFYILLGQAFIPRLGIESDEALFAAPVLDPRNFTWAVSIGGKQIALMVMTYIGAVKTFLMAPVIRNLGGNVWAVREPALIIGAWSIWVFYRLLVRIANPRAAIVGCILLAADTLYLLTSVFDWGPVALQHLLITTAMLCIVRFYQERRLYMLGLGCFFAGLAMWDKAIAIWMIVGLVVGLIAVYGRTLIALATARRAIVAALAFVAGAAPLIAYNVTHDWATFRSNVRPDFSDIRTKAWLLLFTLRSDALFGYLTEAESPSPHAPRSIAERASASLEQVLGSPRKNLNGYALLLSFVAAPFAAASSRRAVLFAIIACAVAWTLMILNRESGGSAHHTILLWPLPIWIIAIGLDAAFRRYTLALAAVTAILCITSLFVSNTYLAQMTRNGGSTSWTTAIIPLAKTLTAQRPSMVYCVDWGILESLRLVSRGKLPLRQQEFDPEFMKRTIADPGNIFVGKTPAFESMRGSTEKVSAFARQNGLSKEMLTTVDDGFGRSIFEIFRFTQTSPSLRPSLTQ